MPHGCGLVHQVYPSSSQMALTQRQSGPRLALSASASWACHGVVVLIRVIISWLSLLQMPLFSRHWKRWRMPGRLLEISAGALIHPGCADFPGERLCECVVASSKYKGWILDSVLSSHIVHFLCFLHATYSIEPSHTLPPSLMFSWAILNKQLCLF